MSLVQYYRLYELKSVLTRKFSRKEFIQLATLATTAISSAPAIPSSNSKVSKIKAVAFDAFPIFDPRPIFKRLDEFFPEKSNQFVEVWQSRQFSYQWLRVSANQYKDFWNVTKDALDFALTQFGLKLSNKEKGLIMAGYETINVWPDVVSGLQAIKSDGLTICFLSNMTTKMLQQGIRNSNVKEFFDLVISTDEMQTYKPSRRAYQMGVDRLKLKKEEILFAPHAGWDMAGAKWFGYPTFWVNRSGGPIEKLDAKPDGIGNDINDLVEFVGEYNNRI